MSKLTTKNLATKNLAPKNLMKTFATLCLATGLAGSLIGCQPKDEKVSTRGGGARAGSSTWVPLDFDDRGAEYSRSLLIELADVARQAETVLAQATAQDGAFAAPKQQCERAQKFSSPEGTIEFLTTSQKCEELGQTFQAVRNGRELSFATFGTVEGQDGAEKRVVAFKVQGKGVGTDLKLVSNPKDTLRVRSFRFLDGSFLREVDGAQYGIESSGAALLQYGIFYETESSYSLNLKAFLDDGQIETKITGSLLYDPVSKKVVAYLPLEKSNRVDLTVLSARRGRTGTFVGRQEFRGSGSLNDVVKLDVEACRFPEGRVDSRFTVQARGGKPPEDPAKRYKIDSKVEYVSSHETGLAGMSEASAKPLSAQLCNEHRAITFSEYYSGLLF
ncbi:MAG: hypothetical protein RBT63_02245 [Bdellovibrionales bacterium]|jgi:hypothetical protein|nr:hypothetical protein [Bdellovibrionales bacterium]